MEKYKVPIEDMCFVLNELIEIKIPEENIENFVIEYFDNIKY